MGEMGFLGRNRCWFNWLRGKWGRGGVCCPAVSLAAWTAERVPHSGDGGVVLRGPDAGLAAGIVADGYGDVAHGCPLDRVGFWLLFSIVRRGRLILCKHSYEKILAPDLKIEPSAKQLELL